MIATVAIVVLVATTAFRTAIQGWFNALAGRITTTGHITEYAVPGSGPLAGGTQLPLTAAQPTASGRLAGPGCSANCRSETLELRLRAGGHNFGAQTTSVSRTER